MFVKQAVCYLFPIIRKNRKHEKAIRFAFGDKDPFTGQMDDLSVSDNGDTEKILATVVSAFCDKYPDAYIYVSGSTKARTRLYRMGIVKHYEQMQKDFYIYGQLRDDFPEF